MEVDYESFLSTPLTVSRLPSPYHECLRCGHCIFSTTQECLRRKCYSTIEPISKLRILTSIIRAFRWRVTRSRSTCFGFLSLAHIDRWVSSLATSRERFRRVLLVLLMASLKAFSCCSEYSFAAGVNLYCRCCSTAWRTVVSSWSRCRSAVGRLSEAMYRDRLAPVCTARPTSPIMEALILNGSPIVGNF